MALSAINAYGIWVIIFFFPIVLAGIVYLVDETRSSTALLLSAVAIGIIAASYIFRFYLVRNMQSLKSRLLAAENREKALEIISGGFWWWLITLICAIAAAITCRSLF